MIVLKDATKRFGALTVLDRVTLRIDPGEFVCVTGPSGAGKSTFLSLLVGAQNVTSGTVMVDGVDLRMVPLGALQLFRRRVGVVFQDYKLLANRTVAENIGFPLEVCGVDDQHIQTRVAELLKRMDLMERAKALPRELSGGEKARAAIARAIAHKPLVVLADEPTGNLDEKQAQDVIDLLKEINAEGATIVLATHDTALMSQLHARVIEFNKGRVVSDTGTKALPTKKEEQAHPIAPELEEELELEPEALSESEDGESVTVTEERKKKKKGSAPRKRKVRITSIHSE